MPYICKQDRKDLQIIIDAAKAIKLYQYNDGSYNFVITKLLMTREPQHYDDYNKLIGILECVKMELYRRMVAPYEDKKKKENGDVYNVS